VEGTGKMPSPKDRVTVQYTGILTNGFKFDSSRDRNSPFSFVIGDTPRRVIPGWEEGISTMKVGGRRQLVIPSRLAYGDEGIQNRDGSFLIPPGATLIFDVELLSSVPSTTA
jgi:peptidylprolyl isomerase